MSTFTWLPDKESEREIVPTVKPVKFGDGYEARMRNAVNALPENWTLTFTRNIEETTPILDFLEERAGVEAFDWTTPRGKTKRFVCRKWKESRQSGIVKVSCTFEEVFEA